MRFEAKLANDIPQDEKRRWKLSLVVFWDIMADDPKDDDDDDDDDDDYDDDDDDDDEGIHGKTNL